MSQASTQAAPYTPVNLKLWEHPDSYAGEVFPGEYVFLSRHRDSDCLAESNFHTALKRLGGESDTVTVNRFHHWAVGWIEQIFIHQDDETALRRADSMLESLDDYPVLDESDFSQREWERVTSFYEGQNLSARIDDVTAYGMPCFAARHSLGKLLDIYPYDAQRMFDTFRD